MVANITLILKEGMQSKEMGDTGRVYGAVLRELHRQDLVVGYRSGNRTTDSLSAKPSSARAGPLSNRIGRLIDPLSDSAHPRLVLNQADRFIYNPVEQLTNGSMVYNWAVTHIYSKPYLSSLPTETSSHKNIWRPTFPLPLPPLLLNSLLFPPPLLLCFPPSPIPPPVSPYLLLW